MFRIRSNRALLGLGLGVGTLAIASCASILGIEELQPSDGGASGGSSSASSSSSSAGGSSGSGTSSSGASGSATGSGGSSAGGAAGASGGATGSGTAGGSGSTGSAGASGASTGSGGASDASAAGGAGGSATDGGSDRGGSGGGATDAGDARPPDTGPATITVSGTVVDIWRHPYPGAPVMIGSTVVTTNASGAFTVPNVTVPYNVSMIIETPSFTEAWEFVGLTRANPTLQFDSDSDPTRSATLNVTSAGAVDPTVFSWGSPDGFFNKKIDATGLSGETAYWSGPLSSAGVAHALKWTTMPDGRPASYLAYDEKLASLANSGTMLLAMDLSADVIPTDTVSGTVTIGELMAPTVDAMLSFPMGGAITVASQVATANAFSYLVPRIANTSITVVALAGDSFFYPFGLAHKRGTAAALAGTILTVPNPAHPVLPRDNGTASYATELSWTGPDQVYVFGSWVVDTSTRYRVVTKQKNGTSFVAHFPKLPPNSGVELAVGKKVNWWAEMQGNYASVDEAAGPQGYADSIDSWDDSTLHTKVRQVGPYDKDGYRVTSEIWQFTSVAP